MAASVRDVQNLVTTVVGLQGNPVSNAVPVVGDALVWDGTQWLPSAPPPPAPPLNGPIIGVTDGSNAAAGEVGEYMINQSQGGLVSGTAANIGSLSLTPGDWDVSGNVALRWIEGSVAANIQVAVGINTTPAVLPSGLGFNGAEGSAQLWVGTPNNGESSLVAGPKRYNVTTATTVYLNVQSFWSGADNPNVVGSIRARRMR